MVGMDDLDVVHLLRREIRSCQFGCTKEVIQSSLFGDTSHLDPAGLLRSVRDILNFCISSIPKYSGVDGLTEVPSGAVR